jgi:hypothetical protein
MALWAIMEHENYEFCRFSFQAFCRWEPAAASVEAGAAV